MSRSNRHSSAKLTIARWRFVLVMAVIAALLLALVWRIAGLQVMPDEARGFEFLQHQGNVRTIRSEAIPANRGVITDRNGEPLAVSTPVATLWANPKLLPEQPAELVPLAKALGMSLPQLQQRIRRYRGKEFMYLARRMAPIEAEAIIALKVPGVFQRREYKRYYPAGEVAAQVVGVTNIDDQGQEGIELAFDEHLSGVEGAKRVLKDLKGNVIKELGLIKREKPGSDLALSIDLRLQYLAYRELKKAMKDFKASAGSVVVLDVHTGEVLAMANQPSFNPNARQSSRSGALRNRAVTDRLEPGSTVKPLTMVAALESGKFHSGTEIDTNPGFLQVGRKAIYDHSNYGVLDLAGVLAKSSQVGTSKVALALEPDHVRDVFARVGLGEAVGIGFPGEANGTLPDHRRWDDVMRTNYSFGYGLNASPLQIAQAYAVLAADGVRKPVTLFKQQELPAGEQVIEPHITAQIRDMMKGVTLKGGTGTKAAVAGYQVSGKTGTVHKVGANGYDANRYMSLFAGMVPADNPRLVTVVVIDEPSGGTYYGGAVAGPVFSGVMTESLRLLRIAPQLPDQQAVASLKELKSQGGSS